MYNQINRWTTATKSKGKDGIYYDSKFEAGYGEELRLRKMAHDIKDYEAHVPFHLDVNGYRLGTYTADFVITHNDDSQEVVETKGRVMGDFALRWKLFEALYSDQYKITLIMQGKRGRPRTPKRIIEF